MNAVTVAPAEPQAELMEHQRNPTSGDAESSVFGVETCPTPQAALSLNNPTPNRAFYGLPDLHVVEADLRSPLAANTGEPRFTSRPLPPSLGDPLCRLMLGITSVTRRLHPRLPPTHSPARPLLYNFCRNRWRPLQRAAALLSPSLGLLAWLDVAGNARSAEYQGVSAAPRKRA